MNVLRHSCRTRINIGTLLESVRLIHLNYKTNLIDFYQPKFETAMAIELNKRLARLSSIIGSVLRFGDRITNSRRPYQ